MELPTVWIDPSECMGAGTCEDIAPEIFKPTGDGLWVVAETRPHFSHTVVFDGSTAPGHGPDGIAGQARVPLALLDDVIAAAEECPGQCIHIEPAR